MVYFTCNHCGESLKKGTVEKHYFGRCRRPKFLTCVDCMKDFCGEEYNDHTKCITEDEKYSAKGFASPSPSVKGETKQLSWLELIQYVHKNCVDIPWEHKTLLKKLCDHTNVPQKKVKFQNFVVNISRQTSRTATDEVWDLLETEKTARKEKEAKLSKEKSVQDNGEEKGEAQNVRAEGVKGKHDKSKMDSGQKSVDNSEEKGCDVTKTKKKRKRDKDNHSMLVNSGDNNTEEEKDCDVTKKKKKKKHDRDNHDILVNNSENNIKMESEVSNGKPSKSKNKRKIEKQEEFNDASVLKKMKQNGENEESVPDETKTGKFNWCKIIVKVLESADNNELSVKRLRKKVISEFSSTGAEVDESVHAKFAKKLSKIPVVVLLKDKAKLKKEK